MNSPFDSLILASTSPYRRELLMRLKLPFEVQAPKVDETPLQNEAPDQLASRLAISKAWAVAKQHPLSLVIGSDQVANLHGQCIGKPHSHATAVEQLQRMRGHTVIFETAVAVVHAAQQLTLSASTSVCVRFLDLSDAQIERYLRSEQPYDCAGSAKSEGLGIALLAAIESNDPTALIGLPLIQTCALLRQAGLDPLSNPFDS
jgi:septum formation protein